MPPLPPVTMATLPERSKSFTRAASVIPGAESARSRRRLDSRRRKYGASLTQGVGRRNPPIEGLKGAGARGERGADEAVGRVFDGEPIGVDGLFVPEALKVPDPV
jgi:hypothetical protein